ncbi:iron-containing alcohol dehydrogenase [Aerococcaceae bacterium 50-4]
MIQSVNILTTDDFVEDAVGVLQEGGYSKPLIVTDEFMAGTDLMKGFLNNIHNAGLDYHIFDSVKPDPVIATVDNGYTIYDEKNCDAVVAIGGGSVLDVARGINILAHNGGQIISYIEGKEVKHSPGLISVPTTSGTGSELSNAVVLTDPDTSSKHTILADGAKSEVAILAPEWVLTLPLGQTIATGLDAFSHAAEAYTSKLATPVNDAICEKVMFIIVNYLPAVIENPNDKFARSKMQVAAALGGWAINNGGTHIGHSIAHITGAEFHVPHGMMCAYALPAALKYVSGVQTRKVKEIGQILGLEFNGDEKADQIGEMVAKSYTHFRDEILGMQPISKFNIDQEKFVNLSSEVVNERFASNTPLPLDENVVKGLMTEIIEGD